MCAQIRFDLWSGCPLVTWALSRPCRAGGPQSPLRPRWCDLGGEPQGRTGVLAPRGLKARDGRVSPGAGAKASGCPEGAGTGAEGPASPGGDGGGRRLPPSAHLVPTSAVMSDDGAGQPISGTATCPGCSECSSNTKGRGDFQPWPSPDLPGGPGGWPPSQGSRGPSLGAPSAPGPFRIFSGHLLNLPITGATSVFSGDFSGDVAVAVPTWPCPPPACAPPAGVRPALG